MAKLGPPESGQFSPFAQMSQGIAALTQPASAPVEKPQQPPAAVGGSKAPQAPRPALAQPERRAEVREMPRPAPRVQAPPVVEPKPTPQPEAQEVTAAVTASLLTMKRFKVSTEESAEMEQASLRLAAKLGVKIDFSKITRALWQVYLRHEEDILRNSAVGMTRGRPANDDTVGLAELDEQLAQIVSDGFMVASRRPANRS